MAQLVEHDLAKVGVAGSSPVSRSQRNKKRISEWISFSCFRGLRSASVVAEQTSPGRFATSHALFKLLKMLINTAFWVFFFFSKAVDSLCRLLKSTGNSIICLFLCQWIADISKRSSEITVP